MAPAVLALAPAKTVNGGPSPKKKATKPVKQQPKLKAAEPMEHHMSPYSSTLIPNMLTSGQAFPYTGADRFSFSQALTETIILGITNVGSAGSCTLIGRQVGAAAPSYSVRTITTMANSDTSGLGPTSCRAMKCGASLTTNTSMLQRGARVTFLNGQSRVRMDTVPSTNNLASFNFLVSTLQLMPTAQAFDNTYFGETREFTCNVVDHITYADFEEFNGTLSADQFFEHIGVFPTATQRDRPMSTIWLIFPPPDAVQTYTLSVTNSWYTRWPVSSIPGQSQTHIPVASAAVINAMHNHADNMSQVVHTLKDVGVQLANHALPMALGAVSRYLTPPAVLALAA